MTRYYSNEDVQKILQHASTLQKDNLVSQERLSELAAEVGISPEILQQAEQVWLSEQQIEENRSKRRSRAQFGFQLHLIPYIFISIFLVILNRSTTPRINWSIYPILGWGMGVAIHAACVFRKQ